MTPRQLEVLTEIRRLLQEAYDDYFKRSDGYHKSSEGYVEVRYPNYFDAGHYEPCAARAIGIYSYVLGPNRMHEFDSFEEALKQVRLWHAEQLASEDERISDNAPGT